MRMNKNLKSTIVFPAISFLMICCTGTQLVVAPEPEETVIPDATPKPGVNSPNYSTGTNQSKNSEANPTNSSTPFPYQSFANPTQSNIPVHIHPTAPPDPSELPSQQPSGISTGQPVPSAPGQSGPPGQPGSPLPGQSGSPLPQSSSSAPNPVASSSAATLTSIPAVFNKMYGAYSITLEGNNIVLKSKGRPSLKSIYYKGTQWEDTLYEAYNGTDGNFKKNSFVISEYDLIIKIPLNPAVDSNHSSYKGTIGMAVDGVAIFDRYTSTGALVTDEQLGFDQNNAHPTPKNIYHYHLEPTGLTRTLGKSALLGFLLDGFPLYGTEENGKTITNADLDTYHGHFGVTSDYPNGIYHYHVTSEEPFIIGTAYYGKPGIIPK